MGRTPRADWQRELDRAASRANQRRRDADRRVEGYPTSPPMRSTGPCTDAMIARRAEAKVAMQATLVRLAREYGTECHRDEG